MSSRTVATTTTNSNTNSAPLLLPQYPLDLPFGVVAKSLFPCPQEYTSAWVVFFYRGPAALSIYL